MLRHTWLCGIVALALWASAPTAHSQERNLNWAEKMFSELEHDFGSVARGADVRHSIVVTNLYEEDISISDVGTTCGCTAAKPDKTLLKTHEQALIEVQMNTVKFMRQKDSNVDVTLTFHGAKGSATKKIRVPIHAYIRPDVVISPANADFGSVEYGAGAERRLEISYAGRDDWRIRDVKVANEHLHAKVQEVSRIPGKVTYQLLVSIDPDAAMGPIQDQLSLITDDANGGEVPVLVVGRVEPDIVVVQPTYPLGNLKPGEEKTFNVVLRGKREFVISRIECESAADCFEVVQPDAQPKKTHIIPFKMTTPDRPGEFLERFSFVISGRAEPLTAGAAGIILAGT